MYEMTEVERAERARVKQLHRRVRADLKEAHRTNHVTGVPGSVGVRYLLLAWGLIRGLPFRRIERSHRFQKCGGKLVDAYGRTEVQHANWAAATGNAVVWGPLEHNLPYVSSLQAVLNIYGEGRSPAQVQAWLDDPRGAIPAPPPRPKKPYVVTGVDLGAPAARLRVPPSHEGAVLNVPPGSIQELLEEEDDRAIGARRLTVPE